MSEWSPWTSCQASCGGPFPQIRTRNKKRQEANGGSCSDDSTTDIKFCGAGLCPPGELAKNHSICQFGSSIYLQLFCTSTVDCIISDWSTWSACPATCGGKFSQTRFRSKTRVEANGGSCFEDLTPETKQCGVDKCPGKW